MTEIRVQSVEVMDDETLMKHLENRHDDDLRMDFKVEPGRAERRLTAPREWRTFHQAMHRLYPRKYDHNHGEARR